MSPSERNLLLADLSCPRSGVMRFRLVYQGPLPSAGNSPKPEAVRDIRKQLSPQMERLWNTHSGLRRLAGTAIVFKGGRDLSLTEGPSDGPRTHPLREHEVNLTDPLNIGGVRFKPLVRKSLDLNCTLDVLFLRREDPGSLLLQAGDIDGRMKTLFDALKTPSVHDVDRDAKNQADGIVYTLTEDDSLVAGVSIETDRLLHGDESSTKEVMLVIQVDVRVLRAGSWNMPLLGW